MAVPRETAPVFASSSFTENKLTGTLGIHTRELLADMKQGQVLMKVHSSLPPSGESHLALIKISFDAQF